MLVNKFLTLDFDVEYIAEYEILEFSNNNKSLSIWGNRYIHELRKWLDNLDDDLNTRKVLNTNGDHEAPEDIYGAQGISDSVE